LSLLGNKKLVPYSLDMIIVGVGCIVSSWNLSPSDCCLNMMPLFHIGGIVRNILSPILSGGCVITCNGFDPLLFWDILFSTSDGEFSSSGENGVTFCDIPKVTWYYGKYASVVRFLQYLSSGFSDSLFPSFISAVCCSLTYLAF
jgi:acyl-CoA synthetase (AMP-forming)/AMP-acid ligase II